jgi:penicillin-binding protein 2
LSSVPAPTFLPPDPRTEEPYRVTPGMALRIAILGAIAVALFCVLFLRLWALQVISGERYLEDARNNQVREFRAHAYRGGIVDRDGEPLVTNTAGTLVQIWPAALAGIRPEKRTAMFRRLSKLLSVPLPEIRAALREHRDDPLTPITVKTSVRDEKVNYLLEHQAEFPGVQVTETHLRRYERGDIAAQVLGYVAEISKSQLKTRADDGYAPGDRIGQTGVEAAFDRYLRGRPGVGQVRVDALGRVTSAREFSQVPEPGDSIRLTIDADLQEAAEKALRFGIGLARENDEWAANGGALVAMDPRSGEILALASNPTFDPDVYVGRVAKKDLRRLADPASNSPTLNRAVAGLYPPGSTFKPVTALAAMQEGMLHPGELVPCVGQMVIDGQTFRNWNPYANQGMTLTSALAESCDTYFYDVGLRFYRREDSPLQKWARRMGFGQPTGVDIGPEAGGLIPTPAWRRHYFDSEIDKIWTSGDSVQLAIGQGDALVTPLQMTRFFALVANGGKLVEPHLVAAVEEPASKGSRPVVLRPFEPKPPKEIGLDPFALKVVREGLYDATHAPSGTSASVFAGFPVPVAGKTGTAEKFVTLPGYQGLRDQSWWCGYAPFDKPELALCAVIENGGFGGAAAAPTALKVFEKYFGVKPGTYVTSAVNAD